MDTADWVGVVIVGVVVGIGRCGRSGGWSGLAGPFCCYMYI